MDSPDAGTPEPASDAAPLPQPDAAPPADAAPPEDPLGTARSARVAIPPTLDGYFSDWSAPFVTFDIADAADFHRTHEDYVDSAIIRFASTHDDDFIYIAIAVTDSAIVVDSDMLYDDDSITIFIDAAGDAGGPYGNDDHEIIINADGTYTDLGPGATPELDGEVVRTAEGYNVEVAIPKPELRPAAPTLPTHLGFDIAITDDDGLGTDRADAYGLWHWDVTATCTSCCTEWDHAEAWCDTTTLGTLILEP